MSTRSRGWALALGIGLTLPATAAGQSEVPDCVEVEAVPRWGASAYDHWVRIQNRCERAVRCEVATNVNPEAQTVTVAAGDTEEVLTWRGSPARTFTPRVRCTEQE